MFKETGRLEGRLMTASEMCVCVLTPYMSQPSHNAPYNHNRFEPVGG